MKQKLRINKTDSKIFADLFKARRPLSVGKIATRTDLSWKTVKDHVEKLEKLKVLNIEKTIRKNRVKIDPKFISELRREKMLKKEKDDFLYGE